MTMQIRELFGFQGRVNRATYAFVGIAGVLLKHNLDGILAYKLLRRPWGIWNYLSPLGMLNGNYPATASQKKFLVILAITTLPFIWLGIGMTLKRLRDAGLPARLVLLFFVPAINVLFFILLCVLPSRDSLDKEE